MIVLAPVPKAAPTERRPYRVDALERALRWPTTGRMSLALGVDATQVRRWRSSGLTAAQADVLAMRCGLHPAEVWPDW